MDIYIKSLIWLLIVNIGSLTSLQNENIPNFLIMMADDLGYGDIGCYGNDTIKTPNIDRLASEGFVFTHHLAASSVCTPSRSAFLTGRYPVRSGMAETGKLRVLPFVASSGGLPDTEITFAKVLQGLGYATALIGKWHLGVSCTAFNDNCHHPLRHGFDRFYGLPLTNLKDFGDDGAGVFMSNNPRIKAGLGWSILVITLSSLWFARYRSMPASDSNSCASNTELNRSIDTEITQSVATTSKPPGNEDNNLNSTQKNVDGNSVANIACCSEKSRILKKVLTDTIYCHLLRWRSSPNSELNAMNNLPKNTGKTCHKSRSPPPPLWRPFCWCVCCMVLPLALFYTFITNIKILNSILMKDTHVVEQPINFANDLSQRLLDYSLQFLGEMAHRPDSNMNDVKGSENRVSKPQQPFLLFFSFLQVHTALHTGPRFHGVSKHGRFGDNVEEMDWMVGQLLDALDRFGFRNNTLIYFTSDQGGHIEEKGLDGQREGGYNGPFKGGKGQGGIEGGIRVPGILRYPPFTDTFYAKTSHNNKHHAPNSINIDIPTSLMDIWPTIVNLAQNAAPRIPKNENSIKAKKTSNIYAQQPNNIYKVWNYYDLAIKTTNNETDPFWGGNEPKTIVIDGRDLAPLLNNYTMAVLHENLRNSEINPNIGTNVGFSTKINAFLKDGLGYLSSPAILYKQRRQDKNKSHDNITNHAKDVNNNHITFNHHEFLFHYCGTHIHAVRYMPKNESLIWKLYYATPKWLPGTQGCHYVCFCYGTRYINYHRPPLLYELTHDPFEDMPIKPPNISTTSKYASTQHSQQNSNMNFTDIQIQDFDTYHRNLSSRYHAIVETIERGMAIHKASIKPVVSQFSASNTVWKPWLQPCCNPPWCHCQEKAF